MPDKMGKELEKSLEKTNQKIIEFEKRAKSSIDSLQDAKDIEKIWKGVQQELVTFQSLLERIDVSKLFPKDIKANIDSAESAAKKYVAALEKAKTTESFQNKLGQKDKNSSELKTTTELYDKESKKLQQQKAVLDNLQRLWTDEVEQNYQKQQQEIRKTSEELEKQKEVLKSLKAEQQKLKDEGVLTSSGEVSKKGSAKAKTDFESAGAELTSAKSAQRVAKSKVTKYKKGHEGQDLSKDKEYTALLKAEETAIEHCAKAQKDYNAAKQVFDKFARAGAISGEISSATTLQDELKKTSENAKEAARELSDQKESLDKAQKGYSAAEKTVEGYSQSIEELKQKDKELDAELKIIQTDEAKTEWQELLNIIKEFMNTDISSSVHDMESFLNALEQYKADKIKELPDVLEEIKAEAQPIAPAMEKIKGSIEDVGDSAKEMTKTQQEVENLKNQVMDFFSLTNSVQLFKRAIQGAMETVKELDATMTEAAVVTEFDVGDMWNKLPQYSKEAQKLGVSINSMYQATTLYYQQGLKSNEAMQLGIETMKMAKIAGMESAEATQAMTAALRGFNMELNETSAVRVNDVYSQLAAVTAADTSQIATAMEKTASIATSANMEFETTAALLAQIIETTQEAPETAGTAMKTIIARFSEVKSLKEQGLSSGKDSEGEDIDVNKIQTALRSVGISMEGYFQGTEGLDSILLKLSEKWGTLDFETQRYIATMAAGSRQQSRFIAMMSDYGRTTELVGEAQNSAGASQKQFQKTQESLETSLTKLKNAWDQFLMGLANNEVLKFGVDMLTKFIEGINKIIDGISGGNGLIKSIVSLVGVIGALKIGKSALGGTGISNIIGKFTGQGGTTTTKETITESEGEDGSIVRTIVREPVKEGEQAGQQAGQGFVAGFKRAVKAGKEGENILKGFFTSEEKVKEINKRKEKNANAVGKKKLSKITDKKEFAKELANRNFNAEDDKKLPAGKIKQEVMTVFETEGADAAIAKYEELGGELLTVEERAKLTADQSKTLGVDFAAAGQAAQGFGALLGGLSAILAESGFEDAAEVTSILATSFMGLGTILSLLPTLFTVVGTVATAAGISTQLAWWWLVLIVAVVVALAAAFIIAGQNAKKASLEGRMQAAAEATERAKEAAEKANEAYEELLEAKSGYDELQEQLDNLTRGTTEWKQALLEANKQVLELLTTYPELAQYLSRGEHGQLVISDEGWDAIIQQQEQAMKNAQVNVMSSQMAETRLQEEKINKDFAEALGYTNYNRETNQAIDEYGNTTTAKVVDGQIEKIYAAYQENGAELFKKNGDEYSQALLDLAESTYMSAEELYNLADELGEYDAALNNNKTTMQAQAEAMIMAGASEDVINSKYGAEIVSGMAKEAVGSDNEEAKELAGELYKNDGASSKDNEKFQELMAQNGLTEKDMTGDDTHDLEVLYAKMAGISRDDIADGLKGDKKALAAEIAKMQVGKETAEKTATVKTNLEKLNKDTQRQFAAAMSGNVKKLSRKDVDAMQNLDLEELAKTMGYENAQAMADAQGITLDELKNKVQQMGTDIGIEFDKITQKALSMGLTESDLNKEYLETATAEQFSTYTDLLTRALAVGADDLGESLDAVMATLSKEQQQQVLDAMSMYDFTQEGEAEAFAEYLKVLGISIPTDKLDKFIDELGKLDAGFKKIDLSKLLEQQKQLLDLGDDLQDRKSSQGLTDEEKKTLVNAGIASEKDFAWTGQEWVYLEGPMGELTKAIKENTGAILDKTRIDLDKQIARGEKVADIGNGQYYNWTKYNSETGGMSYIGIDTAKFKAGEIEDVEFLRDYFDLDYSMSPAEVLNYYKESIQAYKWLGDNKAAKASLEANQVDTAQAVVTGTMLDTKLATGGGATFTGGYAEDEIIQMKALAKAYDVSQQTIDNYVKALASKNAEEANAAAMALKNAIEEKKQEKALGNTLKKLSAVNEEYGDIAEGAQGYEEAINSYSEALGLDTADVDNYAFISDNLSLIQAAADGSVEAILELQKMLAQGFNLVIDAEGNFDLVASQIDMANESVQDFLKNQYEAGNYELVEITATSEQEFIVPDGNGGFEKKKVQTGQTVQILRPQDAESIKRAQGYAGTGGEGEKLENPYDKFYNTTQKINAELREREKLERKYQTLVNRGVATQEELSRLRTQQLDSLEQERAMREGLLQARYNQVGDITSQYSDVAEYASYDKNTGAITIDYNAIEGLAQSGQSDKLDRVTEYIGKLENQQGLIEDELNAILDIEDYVWDIYAQGEDEYFNTINRVKEALIADRQKEIDKLTEINDSINDTNSKIISNMQKQIEQQRQQKENQKTEDSIQDKIYQLEYLKQDSSGANAIAILELEEQIKQEQEDHLANLVDQGIQNLQEQNDQAYEQRQTQIDILQQQLDLWAKSEDIWKKVENIINTGFDPATGKVIEGSDLQRLLASETEGLSQLEVAKWLNDLETVLATVNQYLREGGALHTEYKTGDEVTFTNAEEEELTGIMNKNGDVEFKDASGKVTAIYSGKTFARDLEGKYSSSMTGIEAANKANEEEYDPNKDNKTTPPPSTIPPSIIPPSSPGDLVTTEYLDDFDMANIVAQAIQGQNGWTIEKLAKAVASKGKSIVFTKDPYSPFGYRVTYNNQEIAPLFGSDDSKYSYNNYEKKQGIYTYKHFKTGGLADFTGPAWLDGTKSRPEYILNADQTKAFFQLVDVLSGLKTDSPMSQNTGNYNYDIDINVEKIEKEEDLEMISRKIEDMIVDSIRYRGNNIL